MATPHATSAPYPSAREHLEDELALVGKLFERRIHSHWEAGILPRIQDEFSGTFVSSDEVSAILGGDRSPTEKGELAIAALDREIASRSDQIDARLAASRAAGAPLAFDRMQRVLALTPSERCAMWVLISVELSGRMRALMRYLVNESSRVYADVGLLELLVYSGSARERMVGELAADGRLLALRLVEPVGGRRAYDEAPYLLRSLRVNPRVIELAHGLHRLDREVARVAELIDDPPDAAALLVPDTLKTHVAALLAPDGRAAGARPEAAVAGGPPIVVLAGPDGAGRKSLVFGAARAEHRPVLHMRCPELIGWDLGELARLAQAVVREALLFDALPLFESVDSLAPHAESNRPDRMRPFEQTLTALSSPVAATCAPRDGRPIALGRGLLMVDVPVPTEAARAALWRRALDGSAAPELDFDAVASRYPITGGVLLRSAAAATALAAARAQTGGARGVSDRDVHAGLRGTLDIKLSGLGRRVTWRQGWDDLILPDDSLEEMREFIARVKHKRRVYDEWGFSRKLAKGLGLSALFSGPPGTGKTMVAGIIADELALDLYQIDLSRIVSKYVGETEKNLAELFDAAEAGHAILLFDEADSLFAKRTEVKSSVDRYANLEVNYLLQRMEAFGGITILTTNMDSAIDDAFRRRISFRVNFPFPEPEDRKRLWAVMLPDEADVAGDIDFDLLSRKYEMSGGYIRNAVLRAAFLAADDASPITMSHMMRAANLEYAAMGKVVSSLGH
ncbi:MAG TPA: AAA family ATPase [Kofleriaceae bacterium]|nr:AAA family ATPase [Kofleriaceae bacterium]